MLRVLPFRWQPESIGQAQVLAMAGIDIANLNYHKRLIFDTLQAVLGVKISYCADLEEVVFAVLSEATGGDSTPGLHFLFNPKLTSISCPALTTVGPAGVCMQFNSALTTVSFANLATWGPGGYMLDHNAFTAATVNHILGRMVADPNFSGGEYFVVLSGGTSAAPTGQGATDKATLLARGCYIETN